MLLAQLKVVPWATSRAPHGRMSQGYYKVDFRTRFPRRTSRRNPSDGCGVARLSPMPDAALTPPPLSLGPPRYLDIVLVIAALPLVALAGLPLLGYAVGAAAWIARARAARARRQAQRTTDVRRQVGLNLAARSAAPGSSAAPSSPSASPATARTG